MSFDGANIQQFPDIPAVSAEILALRGWEGEKKRAASDCRGFRGRPPWAHYLTGGLSPCEQKKYAIRKYSDGVMVTR
jgi:hypothetical protein